MTEGRSSSGPEPTSGGTPDPGGADPTADVPTDVPADGTPDAPSDLSSDVSDAPAPAGSTAEGSAVDPTPDAGAAPAPAEGETVSAAVLPGDTRPGVADDAPTGRIPVVGGAAGGAAAAPGPGSDDDDDEWADAEDAAYRGEMRRGLVFGLAGGLVAGALVALVLGAFVWPGYLLGPGSPDDTAAQVTTALANADAQALDAVSCRTPDGATLAELGPESLQLVDGVTPAGPTMQVIDTEAQTPVDLTLSFQGQSQALPSTILLGQNDGEWCFKGLAQRQ